jgi:DNA polymerase-3 subunit beta
LKHLQSVGKVLNAKNSLPILDNFLFEVTIDKLTMTASDLETTLISTLDIEEVSEEGSMCIEARRILDILKEFPEQPLKFDFDMETYIVKVFSDKGVFQIPGVGIEDFPALPEIEEEKRNSVQIESEILFKGITNAFFATADDELRPIMNGVFVEISNNSVTCVASDAHKLVRYRRRDTMPEIEASFILPKKSSSLFKSLLPREPENQVKIEFDDKNAFFEFDTYKAVCRFVEGKYPSYNTVIPETSPIKIVVDRTDFLKTLRRVSVLSNQASNLIKLKLTSNNIEVSGQDIDYAISAVENLPCQYEGEEIEIGFKSIFLIDILSNLLTDSVSIELADSTRAGLLLPVANELKDEDILMLIMPMMLGN